MGHFNRYETHQDDLENALLENDLEKEMIR